MNMIASKAHGGHIVTQYRTTYTKLNGNDTYSVLKNFQTHPDIWGAVHPAPGVGPQQGQAQECILEQNSSNKTCWK